MIGLKMAKLIGQEEEEAGNQQGKKKKPTKKGPNRYEFEEIY
jgi:hypothetical protein